VQRRRYVFARRNERSARAHRGADIAQSDRRSAELRRLHDFGEHLLRLVQGHLLTPGDQRMTRTQIIARGALALVTLGAVLSCDNNTNGDVISPRPLNPIFTSYVALGNSLTAGFQSGGINDSTQKQSYALLLARSMGTRYAYPSLTMPGCPPPLNNFL